jgi:hypothetical protein
MERNNMKKIIYETKDFYNACLLRALGFTLEKIEKGGGKFSIFLFADPHEQATATIERYWKRQQPIEAKDLIDAVHDMKSILYATKY